MGAIEEFRGTERFQILSQMGHGGMGVVYRAMDRERMAAVALKTLRRMSGDALARFKREFRLIQELQHPNLVSLHELFEHEGQWFFTMELVEGLPFRTWVEGAERPRVRSHDVPTITESPRRTADHSDMGLALRRQRCTPRWSGDDRREERLRGALPQLARGLDALHRAGRVHRDIKPSNVLVTHEGRVVILDFGLVTELGKRVPSDDDGAVGTYLYMAPEQAAGEAVDEAADWYSVGVMLYDVLVGAPPFDGLGGVPVMMLKQVAGPAPVRLVNEEAPPDLAQLCDDLLGLDPHDRPRGGEILRRLRPQTSKEEDEGSRSTRSAPRTPDAFVGREAELAFLLDRFDEVPEERTRIVVVEGTSGIGKTTLLRRCAAELMGARKGALVFSGRCFEAETLPYKGIDGVVDEVARFLEALPAHRVLDLLPPHVDVLARAFPVLSRVDAVAEARRSTSPIEDPRELRAKVFTALRELFQRIGARHRAAVIIDDMQWSDEDSLAVLGELTRMPGAPAVLTVLGRRTDEGSTATLPSLFDDGRPYASLELGPLDERAARQLGRFLLRRIRPNEREEEDIYRESRGHPLFIDTLTRHLRHGRGCLEDIGLDEAVERDISDLDRASRAVLETVALSGSPVGAELVAEATGLQRDTIHRSSKRLRALRLLRGAGATRPGRLEPYHDRIRRAVLEQIPSVDRPARHRHVALAMKAIDADVEALAAQWALAGEANEAARFAVLAGERAYEALAFERAAKMFERALTLVEHPAKERRRLTTRRGDALSNAGKGRAAAESYRRALDDAEPADALYLRRRMAEELLQSGHFDEGIEAFHEVFSALGMRYPRSPRAAFWALVRIRLLLRLRGLGYEAREADSVPDSVKNLIDSCHAAMKGMSSVDPIRAQLFLNRALLLALRKGDQKRVIRALALEIPSIAIEHPNDTPRRRRFVARVLSLAEKTDDLHLVALVKFGEATALHIEAEWAKARRLLEDAEPIFRSRCTGASWEISLGSQMAIRVLWETGRWTELVVQVPRAIQEARERGDRYTETVLRTSVMSLVHVIRDQPGAGRAEIEAGISQWSREGFHVQHVMDLFHRSLIDLYEDRGREGHARLLAATPDLGNSLLMRVTNIRIGVDQVRAQTALAAKEYRRARKVAKRLLAEGGGWAPPLAHLTLAGLEHHDGNDDEALLLLEHALAGFEAADAQGYANAVRLRKGQLLGGARGREAVDQAFAWFDAQGVLAPKKIARLLAPGFADP